MITLFPISSGIPVIVQFSRPSAVPSAPVEVDHVTRLTPALSDALPLTLIDGANVPTLVIAGSKIVRDGRVVSVASAATRVTVIVRTT
jgi:hypothetical protein